MNLETYASDIATVIPAFATPDPITVSIDLPVGDVRVVASDRADTIVQVSPSDESREADVRDAGQTRVERTPDGLLITGDIGQAQSVERYLRALDKALPMPIYFVLGNHDYYAGADAVGFIGTGGRAFPVSLFAAGLADVSPVENFTDRSAAW